MYRAIAELNRRLAADFPDGPDTAALRTFFRRDQPAGN
jgi:hypothetical protein